MRQFPAIVPNPNAGSTICRATEGQLEKEESSNLTFKNYPAPHRVPTDRAPTDGDAAEIGQCHLDYKYV
jgi:hypothetical protein